MMRQVEKILVPTDLSENSRRGLAYAVSLARQNRAEVIIFHATSFPWDLSDYPCELELFLERAQVSKLTVDKLLREERWKLDQFIHAHFEEELPSLRWRPKVGLGNASTEIVTAAIQEEVDLIVMAKRKRGALGRLLSRSISEAVSRNAPCPVLTLCPPHIARPWIGGIRVGASVLRGSEI